MDIFTTQLTKVRQASIKPNKLKVKSLNKDAQTRGLNDEKDHLTGETTSPDLHITQYHFDEEDDKEKSPPSENASLTIEQQAKSEDNLSEDKAPKSDQNTKHIDLFI